MKPRILLFALAAVAFTSCTAYKTGQTPDDVYYSPEKPADEYVRADRNESQYYQGDDQYYEDRYLRMRIRDRYQWSYLDDYYFYNRPSYFAYGYYGYSSWNFGSPWNSYWYWNNFYNPYCRNTVVYHYPKGGGSLYRQPVSRPVVFNPDSYTNVTSNNRSMFKSYNSNGKTSFYNNSTYSRYNNSNSNSRNSSLGNSLRKVFTGSGNSSSGNNSTYTPSRSYNPSSSSGSSGSRSSGSSSGSSGGGVSRPTRGGGR